MSNLMEFLKILFIQLGQFCEFLKKIVIKPFEGHLPPQSHPCMKVVIGLRN
jgi:hypothetical protein